MMVIMFSRIFILLLTRFSTKSRLLPVTLQSNTMKIFRKERIDVKKYMEDMKANKTATKRTFASVQERTTHPKDRISRDRLMNQYDIYSNHSMPQFSRPTHKNQSFPQGNNIGNLYNQFDIMSQTSHKYMQNYVTPPMIVPQMNPNLYYNQMPAYYGASQYPQNQYIYPNVNTSNVVNNYEYPQMNQVFSPMNTQPFVEKQEMQNSNSRPELLNKSGEDKFKNSSPVQVIELKKQTSKQIEARRLDLNKKEVIKMDIQSKEEGTATKNIFRVKSRENLKEGQFKQIEAVNQQTVKKQQQKAKKKKAYKRKQPKQKEELNQQHLKDNKLPDFIQITEDVNKQFEEMLQKQKTIEAQKDQIENICQKILTLVDAKLRQSYAGVNLQQISEQLQKRIKPSEDIDTKNNRSVKKQVSNALTWLQKLKRKHLQIK